MLLAAQIVTGKSPNDSAAPQAMPAIGVPLPRPRQ